MFKKFNLYSIVLLMGIVSVSFVAVAQTMSPIAHQTIKEKTVTLSVPGMTCSACPITVRKALKSVSGVSKVTVHFKKRIATVTFNPKKTSVKILIKTTTNVGYPSTLQKAAK